MSDQMRPIVLSADEYRQQQAAQAKADAAAARLDETVVGGCYLVGDEYVDANGVPIKEQGKAAADEPPVDEGPYKGKSAAELKALAEQRGLDAGTTRKTALAALLAADGANPAE